MVSRLIVASNRLPVSITLSGSELSLSHSNGGLATALSSLFKTKESVWVGWTGLRQHLSKTQLASLAMPAHLKPVNLTDTEVSLYYDQFANGILWPIAHGLKPTINFHEKQWQVTKDVTEKFAHHIKAIAKKDDLIWVHDYHLFLLPAELRRLGVTNRIGFFAHTPFPLKQNLLRLAHGNEIMSSLLSVDLLGVQTKKDVQRIKSMTRSIPTYKQPRIKAFPIGVDFTSFDEHNNDPEVIHLATEHRKKIGKKTVILSMSRLDYTKGICTQLRAYEHFLITNPQARHTIYRLNVAPSRESVLEYRELREEIEQTVASINQKFGTTTWQPVMYSYDNLNQKQLAAWYQISDVHLNIPIADGMNLIAKEYIAARREPGVLIISETMGAALQLDKALIVPPEDYIATTAAITTALTMTLEEKRSRWQALRHEVATNTVRKWADTFISDLRAL